MRRRKMKRQKQIIIISSLCLLLCLCVGYAAFNTQISLKAKGNIKKVTTASKLRKLANAKSSDGLFADTYESGRYIFKGADPNNYITFNDEEWRIVSVEYDDTIKIIKNASLDENLPWDTATNLDWSKSSLSKYLNETYVNSLVDSDSVVSHNFAVGAFNLNGDYTTVTLNDQILSENANYWSGKVGLLNVSEYLRANTNGDECGSLYLNNTNYEKCRTTNYLSQILVSDYTLLWTMSPIINNTNSALNDETDNILESNDLVDDTNTSITDDSNSLQANDNSNKLVLDSNYNYVFGISVPFRTSNFTEQTIPVGSVSPASVETSYGVVPVVYLNADVVLEGNGTKDDPYYIEKQFKQTLEFAFFFGFEYNDIGDKYV